MLSHYFDTRRLPYIQYRTTFLASTSCLGLVFAEVNLAASPHSRETHRGWFAFGRWRHCSRDLRVRRPRGFTFLLRLQRDGSGHNARWRISNLIDIPRSQRIRQPRSSTLQ